MYPLSLSEAIKYVRRNLDEYRDDDTTMLGMDSDTVEFESAVRLYLPEAINAIHGSAPLSLLRGKILSQDELDECTVDGYGVLFFGIKNPVLRLLRFQTTESQVVVTDVVEEDSTLGRMQLNPYTRGCSSNPCLVHCAFPTEGSDDKFAYYAVDGVYAPIDNAWPLINTCEYLPRYNEKDTKLTSDSALSYGVAEKVLQNVVDYLTGLICVMYNMGEKAKFFFDKASFATESR